MTPGVARPRRVLCYLLLALLVGACSRERDVILGPGILAPDAPVQLAATPALRELDGFRLTTRANFTVRGKLLSKRRYRWDDLAPVVPWDFALAWGPMSDEAVLAGTRLVQGDRRMFWHLYDLPLPLAVIEHHSANVHLIPATPAIGEQLERAQTGTIVELRGELVDLSLPDGGLIPTSLSRRDRGAGACEILFVTGLTVTGA